MYTTRPLSVYKKSPEAISMPPEGPNSGYLVLQDKESTPTCCLGICRDPAVNGLPFPQNKLLFLEYHVQGGSFGLHSYDAVYLIPVVNQPLSSNWYYAIKADGKKKGEAYVSSKDQDKGTCCFCWRYVKDIKTRPLDPEDTFQQFEFSITKTCTSKMLVAKSVNPDGHPPSLLDRKGWSLSAATPKNFTLGEARGLDIALRALLPQLNFPLSQECSNTVVVGKWYIPFMFVKEGTVKQQVKNTVFYEMTLEQRWERVFACDSSKIQGKIVTVDVVVQIEGVMIDGKEAMLVERNDEKRVVWFRNKGGKGEDDEEEVGLSSLVLERMMWEQDRGGWVKRKEKQVRVVKEEEHGGSEGWKNFGCYLLVESFVLKRNDGSLVLTYDFRHIHHLRSKWE